MSKAKYRVEFDNMDTESGFVSQPRKDEAVKLAKSFKDRRGEGFTASRVKDASGETIYKWWLDGNGQVRELDFYPISRR